MRDAMTGRCMRRPRRRTRRGLFVLTCVCAASAVVAGAPVNIDTGFVQDGKTTYCQGIQDDQGPLVFESLDASSAGKCPIDVQILAETAAVAPMTSLAVRWAAWVHRGALATNLFPNVVDPSTKKPLDVIASLLRACKIGTNCAAPESIVEPAVFTDDPSTDTGAFDGSGLKTLKSYQFQFPQAGDDYVIVAKVVLPGDPTLNISAQEFVAFQRIHVTTDLNSTTATVRPGNAGEAVSDSDASSLFRSGSPSNLESRSAVDSTNTAPQNPVDTGGDGANRNSAGNTNGHIGTGTKTVSILGAIAAVVAVIVVVYAAVGLREKRKLEKFAQRPTRSFSQSFQNLECDPEPIAPMQRQTSHESNHPRRSGSQGRSDIVGRPSRSNRSSRISKFKVPGGDLASPAPGLSRLTAASLKRHDSMLSGGSSGLDPASHRASMRPSQYTGRSTTTHSLRPSATIGFPVVRPSQKHGSMSSRMDLRDLSSSSVFLPKPYLHNRASSNASASSSMPYVVRVSRNVSTSSTQSLEYSNSSNEGNHEGSTYSLSGGLKHVTATHNASFENAAIMESVEHRRSSVVLLESPTATTKHRASDLSSFGSPVHRASDLSSLGSLHDHSVLTPLVHEPIAVAISRASASVSVSHRDTHTSRPSSLYPRPSARGGSESLGSRSTLESVTYLRDTSEFNAPFSERNSESDWMDYQL